MTKPELDLKLNGPISMISSLLIAYLLIKYQDNPISDKVYHSLLINGGLNQLILSNVSEAANKVLAQIEQKVLMAGSGIGTDGKGQRIIAGFVDSVNPVPEPKPKEETKEAYLKATLSLNNSKYCPNCALPMDTPILCTNCGYREE